MKSVPTIEPARPEDEAAIRALLCAAGLPHGDFAAHLAHFLVVRENGAVVGAAGYERHGDDGLLRSLVVAPAARSGGRGRRLVGAVAGEARRAGVKRFYLLTTTAEVFFARLGFVCVSRDAVPAAIAATREFAGLCPASAVCMTREAGE